MQHHAHVGVSIETRRKNNRWRVQFKGKHVDYVQTFEEANQAVLRLQREKRRKSANDSANEKMSCNH